MKQAPFDASLSLTPAFVAEALRIPLPPLPAKDAGPHQPFTRVTTDSRKAGPGCLFVALPGEKFDGHDFIANAVTQGARAILCTRGKAKASDFPGTLFFTAESSLEGYRKLAAAWRHEFSLPLVAVAGSVGKTTTKEMLAAILSGKWKKVLKTQGSQNGFVGIPMTLLELQRDHEAAVIEVGIDEIGAMEQHMELVAASASLLTAIGPEHLEKLQDLPTVAREEGLALSAVAGSGGAVAINLDDSWIRPYAKILRSPKRLCYTLASGTPPAADPQTLVATLASDQGSITLNGAGLSEERFTLPLPGLHNARNLLGALAVARLLGLTAEEMRRGLDHFAGAQGRSEVRKLPNGSPAVCDYYNASPVSMEAGLELLAQVARKDGAPRARWACLGDMLELGVEEEKFHRELAGKIIATGVEQVLLYGPRMEALLDELKFRNFAGQARHFATHAELARALTSEMKPGDAVLIKGSRGMRMEEVWKVLENR